jgi:hypothetical protein
MGNRPIFYWIVLMVAIAAVAAAFILRSSPDAHTRELARYLGYGAIALLVIARFTFARPTRPAPPMPKN